MTSLYSDYRLVEGLKFAFTTKSTNQLAGKITMKIERSRVPKDVPMELRQ